MQVQRKSRVPFTDYLYAMRERAHCTREVAAAIIGRDAAILAQNGKMPHIRVNISGLQTTSEDTSDSMNTQRFRCVERTNLIIGRFFGGY